MMKEVPEVQAWIFHSLAPTGLLDSESERRNGSICLGSDIRDGGGERKPDLQTPWKSSLLTAALELVHK